MKSSYAVILFSMLFLFVISFAYGWFDVSYGYRYPIIVNNTSNLAISVNGTNGLNGNIIWALTTNESYVYSETAGTTGALTIANDTDGKYWENETIMAGNSSTSMWSETNANAVYHFYGTAGGTGNPNSSTLTNNATANTGVYNTSGKFGTAIHYISESTQSTTVADDANLDFTTAFTMIAWVRLDKLNANQMVVHKDDVYNMYVDNSNHLAAFLKVNGATKTPAGATAMAKDTWYQLAVTYDGSNIRGYVNEIVQEGTFPMAASGVINTSAGNLYIGKHSAGLYYMNGTIDELRLYNRTLSQAEILNNYWNGINNITRMGGEENVPSNGTSMAVVLNEPSDNSIFKNTWAGKFNATATWGDDTVENCSLYFNNTLNTTNTSAVTNNTKFTITSTVEDGIYYWNVGCYNSSNTIRNATANRTLIIDTVAPTYSKNYTSGTANDTSVTFQLEFTDNRNLTKGGYIFSTNNTGGWENSSYTAFTSNPQNATNITTLNDTSDINVQWKFYANDSVDNWVKSTTYNLTVTNASFVSIWQQGNEPAFVSGLMNYTNGSAKVTTGGDSNKIWTNATSESYAYYTTMTPISETYTFSIQVTDATWSDAVQGIYIRSNNNTIVNSSYGQSSLKTYVWFNKGKFEISYMNTTGEHWGIHDCSNTTNETWQANATGYNVYPILMPFPINITIDRNATAYKITAKNSTYSIHCSVNLSDVNNTDGSDYITVGRIYSEYLSSQQFGTRYFNLSYTGTTEPTPSAMTVALNEPVASASDQPGTINFNATATWFADSIQNCSLYLNSSGAWALNETNATKITNNTKFNISQTLPVGAYLWNMGCWNETNEVFDASNRTLILTSSATLYKNSSTVKTGEQNYFKLSEDDLGTITSIDLKVFTPKGTNYTFNKTDFTKEGSLWVMPFHYWWNEGNHTINGTVNGAYPFSSWVNVTFGGFYEAYQFGNAKNLSVHGILAADYWTNTAYSKPNEWWNSNEWDQAAKNLSDANYTSVMLSITYFGVCFQPSPFNDSTLTATCGNLSMMVTPNIVFNITKSLHKYGMRLGWGLTPAVPEWCDSNPTHCNSYSGQKCVNFDSTGKSFFKNLTEAIINNYSVDYFVWDTEYCNPNDEAYMVNYVLDSVIAPYNKAHGTDIYLMVLEFDEGRINVPLMISNSTDRRWMAVQSWDPGTSIGTGMLTVESNRGINWGMGISGKNDARWTSGVLQTVSAEQVSSNLQVCANYKAPTVHFQFYDFFRSNTSTFWNVTPLTTYKTGKLAHGYNINGLDVDIWAYYTNSSGLNVSTADIYLNYSGAKTKMAYNAGDGLYKATYVFANDSTYYIQASTAGNAYRWGYERMVTYYDIPGVPQWSGMSSSYPSPWNGNKSYFNISWNGAVAVTIEMNYSGAANYTMNNSFGGNKWNYTADLPAGAYYWKSYGQNLSGTGVSSTYAFTIPKATPTVAVSFNVSNPQEKYTPINVSCVCADGFSVKMYNSSAEVTNPYEWDTGNSPLGNNNFICNTTATQNYSTGLSVGTMLLTLPGALNVSAVYDENNLTNNLTFDIQIYNASYTNSTTNISSYYNNIVFGNITIVLSSTGYYNRYYYQYVSPIGGTVSMIGYLVKIPNASLISFTTKNTFEQLLEDVNITISRLLPTITVITSGTTDSSGVFSAYLDPMQNYHILVRKEGYQDKDITLTPTTSAYTIYLQSNTAVSTPAYWSLYSGMSASCNYANGTRMLNCTWNDTTGRVTNVSLDVVKKLPNGTFISMCGNYSVSGTGSFLCDFGAANNSTYSWTLWGEYDNSTKVVLASSSWTDIMVAIFGAMGLFMAFMIILVSGSVGIALKSPIFTVVMTLVGVGASMLIGMITFTGAMLTFMMGLFIAGAVLVYKLR